MKRTIIEDWRNRGSVRDYSPMWPTPRPPAPPLNLEALREEAMCAARRRIAEVSIPRGAPVVILLHEGGQELDLWAGTLVRSWSDPEAIGAELFAPVERMVGFMITPYELHRGYRQDQDGEPYLVLGVDRWAYKIVPMEPDP